MSVHTHAHAHACETDALAVNVHIYNMLLSKILKLTQTFYGAESRLLHFCFISYMLWIIEAYLGLLSSHAYMHIIWSKCTSINIYFYFLFFFFYLALQEVFIELVLCKSISLPAKIAILKFSALLLNFLALFPFADCCKNCNYCI